MRTIRGRYNGTVVVLEEPAPVDHAVDVEVEFPMDEDGSVAQTDRFGWNKTRHLMAGCDIDSTEIIRRIRDME